MSTLAEVLGWKFNHEPGIVTRGGSLIAWPPTLGALPTPTQIVQWTAEYELVQDDVRAAAKLDGLVPPLLFDLLFELVSGVRAGPPADKVAFRDELIAKVRDA